MTEPTARVAHDVIPALNTPLRVTYDAKRQPVSARVAYDDIPALRTPNFARPTPLKVFEERIKAAMALSR